MNADYLKELLESLESKINPKWLVDIGEFDSNQRQANSLKEDDNFLIRGCAGSGKSILALHRAVNFLKKEKTCTFVVYTKALEDYIKDGLEALISKYKLTQEYKVYISICHYDKLNFKNVNKSDYLIVDEIQDLKLEDIRKLVSLSKNFTFYGDNKQQIYGNKNNYITLEKIAEEFNIDNSHILELDKNYRNTLRIAKFCCKIIDDYDFYERTKKNPYAQKGTYPKIKEFSCLYEELEFILNFINDEKITNIGILFPTNERVEQAREFFNSKGISVDYKYRDKHGNDNLVLNFNRNFPKLLCYHSAKGVQFDYVFLPTCDIYDKEEVFNYKNALYVACSRAKKMLYIFYTKELSFYIKEALRKERKK